MDGRYNTVYIRIIVNITSLNPCIWNFFVTVICFFLNVLQRRYYGRKRSHTFKRYGSYKNVWYLKGSDSFLKDMVHLKRYDTNTAGKFKKVSYQPKSDLKFTFLNYDCFSLVVKVEHTKESLFICFLCLYSYTLLSFFASNWWLQACLSGGESCRVLQL